MWPTLSPEVIAGSARASLLLGAPGVLLAPPPGDQCREIQDRLWELLDAAQADPAAAVVEVHPPLLELPPAPPAPEAPPPPRAPADWLSPSETCELLEISLSTLKNWRLAGRFGQGWGKCGRGYRYSPEVVEGLLDQLVPPSLVELMDQIRKEREA